MQTGQLLVRGGSAVTHQSVIRHQWRTM